MYQTVNKSETMSEFVITELLGLLTVDTNQLKKEIINYLIDFLFRY